MALEGKFWIFLFLGFSFLFSPVALLIGSRNERLKVDLSRLIVMSKSRSASSLSSGFILCSYVTLREGGKEEKISVVHRSKRSKLFQEGGEEAGKRRRCKKGSKEVDQKFALSFSILFRGGCGSGTLRVLNQNCRFWVGCVVSAGKERSLFFFLKSSAKEGPQLIFSLLVVVERARRSVFIALGLVG